MVHFRLSPRAWNRVSNLILGTSASALIIVTLLVLAKRADLLDEAVWHFLARVAKESISAKGTSLLGLVVAASYPLIRHGLRSARLYREKGKYAVLEQVKASEKLEDALLAVGIAAMWWIAIFLWNTFTIMPPTYSPIEIADYGTKSLVAVSTDSPSVFVAPKSSGFWLNEGGDFITCCYFQNDNEAQPVLVATLLPLYEGKHINVYNESIYLNGYLMGLDTDTGVAVGHVSALFRKKRLVGRALLTPPQKAEAVYMSSNVPRIYSKEDMKAGQTIFISALTLDQGSTVVNITGRIERTSRDDKAKVHWKRLHTSIKSNWLYYGAPVFNEQRQIVGVVGKSDGEDLVIVPATYIVALANEDRIPVGLAQR